MFWVFWWLKRVFLCQKSSVLNHNYSVSSYLVDVFHVLPTYFMFSHHDTAWECDQFFGPKHTFFVIHGGSQMTFMTQLEKVIIFRPKHKFFVIHGGPKWTFRCLDWHNSTEGKLNQNSVKVDFPRLQVDALYCICINIICIASFLLASILSASLTFKLQPTSS